MGKTLLWETYTLYLSVYLKKQRAGADRLGHPTAA